MRAAHVLGTAVGATLLACGAHYLVRALTGKTPLEHARELLSGQRPFEAEPVARQNRTYSPQPPVDPVDEASWESFPASDPPAHSPKNA